MQAKINIKRINRDFNFKIFFLAVFIFLTSCKKFVDVNPPITQISGEKVYKDDVTATGVVTGLFGGISGSGILGGIGSLSLYPGLSADELSLFGTNTPFLYYYQDALSNTRNGGDFWTTFYYYMYIANAALEGISVASDLTPAVQKQLLGELKFMRAFYYFYLVNLYGDVPLVTGTNYSINRLLARTPKTQVWGQIISDLQAADSLLSPNYLDQTLLNTTPERVRPTKWAAASLMARAYLYEGKWDSAIAEADSVIGQTAMYSLVSLDSVFLRNSNEAVWQLQPVIAGENTQEALLFVLPTSGPDGYGYPVYLNPDLVNSFEFGDQRLVYWVGSVPTITDTFYYPFKYKQNTYSTNPPTEYSTVLRLAEQYLIRAEAKLHLQDIAGARADLNIVRQRAGLSANSDNTVLDLQNAILHERRVELFTEWGHRWFDLKRTGAIDSTMSKAVGRKGTGIIWHDYDQLYPLALTELEEDPNLIQNSGY